MSMKRSPISTSGATFALTLLAAFASQAVEARTCGYDRFGRYRCTGLLGGTVGGIVAAAVGGLLLLLLLLLCVFRRRRSRRTNQAYVNQPQPEMQQPQGYYGPGPTQYPTEQASYGNGQYGQQQTYAPPNSPPPVPAYSGSANYAPPPGPPPAAHVAGGGGEAAGYYGNRSAV